MMNMVLTPPVGIFPPNRWTHMAGTVHDWLRTILDKDATATELLPPEKAYREARLFLFVAAGRTTGDPTLDHAEAQFDRLALSRELLMEARIPTPHGALPVMHMFCSFFESIGTRHFYREERGICTDLAQFFLTLKHEGEHRRNETMEGYWAARQRTTSKISEFMGGMLPNG